MGIVNKRVAAIKKMQHINAEETEEGTGINPERKAGGATKVAISNQNKSAKVKQNKTTTKPTQPKKRDFADVPVPALFSSGQ